MEAQLSDDLADQEFDAVIIGGGINGAGVARDAALRGLSVCLFEKGDFASGTSSKSTKIAHGGLRYLRNLEFGLVREAQLERRWLRKALPHLVEPLSFCYPVYRDGPDPFWKVRLGVTVYDLLDGRRQPHKSLSASDALASNPALRSVGLMGALRYWDDRMDDARVCLETILSAEEAGAECLNYTSVLGIQRMGRGFEVTIGDSLSHAAKSRSVFCKVIVNCAGPWAESVIESLRQSSRPLLAPTKGVHIVVPRVEGDDALVLENVEDKRTFFAIPWHDQTLIGTTDTFFDGPADSVAVEDSDVDYLLDAASYYLPGAHFKRRDVLYSFAGLRALVAPGGDPTSEGKISRRHLVLRDTPGVITLAGGKFTTFRHMAEDAVDALVEEIGLGRRPAKTKATPYFQSRPPKSDATTAPALWRSLQQRYGPRAGAVFDICNSDEILGQRIIECSPVRVGEFVFAAQSEKTRSIRDFIERRTHLAWQAAGRELHDRLLALKPYLRGRMDGAPLLDSSDC
jgi:glycerol-3-phosphate dehydrogenase